MSAATATAVKNNCSIFTVPPDYFDTCHLLQSPDDSSAKTNNTTSIETLEDDKSTVAEAKSKKKEPEKALVTRLSCNTCKAEFDSLSDQRSHFKSDLHRLNTKSSIPGNDISNAEDFDKSTSTSSLQNNNGKSGSKNKKKKKNDDEHKLFIRLQDGERVSLYKCLLLDKNEEISFESEKIGFVDNNLRENELIERLKLLIQEPRDNTHLRVVLLASSEHFAGCVFDGESVVAHKTFHRYTVRAKAGSQQSSKDASGKSIHSAGASIRRYNELALKKEIGELLATWKPYFDASSRVFIYAPSSNRQHFFNKGKPVFSCKHHGIVRSIPVTVERPTLEEAKRIYNILTKLYYQVDEENSTTTDDEIDIPVSNNSESESGAVSIESGNVPEVIEMLEQNLDINKSDISVSNESENEVCISTPLHEASKSGNSEKVLELLEQGLDPCAKDERGRTPYMVTNDKEVRNNFRRFMALNLDKWDWHAANVPSALTKELEEAQAAKQAEKDAKKKARAKELKKLRKAKEKKAQAETALSQSSPATSGSNISKEEELRRAQAEEREKRAAAAERRMASLSGNAGGSSSGSISQTNRVVTDGTKCSCCEISLVGIVPFHRYNYKYCSTSCMHVHREILEDG